MKLYVVRHGQTDWNLSEKVQGRTDIELNQTGIEQAKQAKENLSEIDFDLVISSPLKRTRKTAEIINEDRHMPLIFDERLMERGFGDVEGTTPSKTGVFKGVNIWNYNENINYKNVEPIVEMCNRVWSFLDEIKEKYSEKNVLLVTHGGTMRIINAYFNGINENGLLPRIEVLNCEVKEYEYAENLKK